MSQCEKNRPSRRWALNSPDTHVIFMERNTHTDVQRPCNPTQLPGRLLGWDFIEFAHATDYTRC